MLHRRIPLAVLKLTSTFAHCATIMLHRRIPLAVLKPKEEMWVSGIFTVAQANTACGIETTQLSLRAMLVMLHRRIPLAVLKLN